MKCEHCGFEMADDARFCPECGTKVGGQQSEIKETLPVRTLEDFKKELSELKEWDSESRAVINWWGVNTFYKWIFPILNSDEKVTALRHIQSNVLFHRISKEFLLVTNQRVISFRKIWFVKPFIKQIDFSQITSIEAEKERNAIYGIAIGEKLSVAGGGKNITVRTVGKGMAQTIKYEILAQKDLREEENSVSGIPAPETPAKKNTVPIIAGCIAGAILLFLAIGALSGSGSTELYDCLPYAKADVEKFLSKNGIKQDEDMDDVYGDDDIMVILNERGNIDMIVITVPGYTLCGVEVGDTFDVLKDSKKFTKNGYSFLAENDFGDIFYGIPNGKEGLGGDQVIGLETDGMGVVTEISFSRTGAKELVESAEELKAWQEELESWLEADDQEFIFEDSSRRYLTDEEVMGLSETDRLYALAEIFARHGADFSSLNDGGQVQDYLNSKSWYEPVMDYNLIDDKMFNDYENYNGELIVSYIEGMNRTDEAVGNLCGRYQMKIDINGGAFLEIRDYPEEGVYFAYFSGSYSYYAGETYGYIWPYTDGTDNLWEYYEEESCEPSMLLLFDKDGVTVESLDGNNFGGMYFPGFGGTYMKIGDESWRNENAASSYIIKDSSSRYLTESDLYYLSKEELRLARNEIYARHGRKFETADLNEYFTAQLWYVGYLSQEEFDDSVLNEYEKANLLLIQSAERR